MKKHRWREDTEHQYGTKPHTCLKCGIHKKWLAGEDQYLEYWWNESYPAYGGGVFTTTKTTYDRPDCVCSIETTKVR